MMEKRGPVTLAEDPLDHADKPLEDPRRTWDRNPRRSVGEALGSLFDNRQAALQDPQFRISGYQ